MSVVEHMVCPACVRMNGQEHEEACPWNGLGGGVRPRPGQSEDYRSEKIETLLRELEAADPEE